MNGLEVNVGILDCGIIKDDQRHRAQKIQKIYSDLGIKSQIIKIVEGEKISSLDLFSHFIVTGSGFDYDVDLEQIDYLKLQINLIGEKNIPTLGICFGAQVIANEFGGVVEKQNCGEIGFCEIEILKEHKIFSNINNCAKVFQYHFDHIKQIPDCGDLIARSDCCNQGFSFKNFIGIQFHPEIDHSFAKCEYNQIREKLMMDHNVCENKFTQNFCPDNQIEKVFNNFISYF